MGLNQENYHKFLSIEKFDQTIVSPQASEPLS
jgi:hypothetical protein